MILVIQIAAGFVLGVILLRLLPDIFNALFSSVITIAKALKQLVYRSAAPVLVLSGVVLFWFFALVYVPKIILVGATFISFVSMIALAVVSIRDKIPMKENIILLSFILLGAYGITFLSAYSHYEEYGVLGKELEATSPLFISLAIMGWASHFYTKKIFLRGSNSYLLSWV